MSHPSSNSQRKLLAPLYGLIVVALLVMLWNRGDTQRVAGSWLHAGPAHGQPPWIRTLVIRRYQVLPPPPPPPILLLEAPAPSIHFQVDRRVQVRVLRL